MTFVQDFTLIVLLVLFNDVHISTVKHNRLIIFLKKSEAVCFVLIKHFTEKNNWTSACCII